MDTAKNIQKSDHLQRFLDGVRSIRTNPFGENKAGERAYRRAERIVAAIHLLTNHVPDTEPLRARIRTTSLELLDQTVDLRDEMRSMESRKVYEFQVSIRQLISLLRILAVAGFVSIQNADVVTEALDELGNFLSVSQRSPISENIKLSREDLLDVRSADVSFRKDIKDRIIDKDGENVVSNVHKESTTAVSVSVRAGAIIDVLRAGGEFGIRDIVAHIPEYSEKMIQRELLELVQVGLVRRTGLKRWSKYSLAQV